MSKFVDLTKFRKRVAGLVEGAASEAGLGRVVVGVVVHDPPKPGAKRQIVIELNLETDPTELSGWEPN